MKKIKLTDIAPYSGKRVQPFNGVKRYMSTGDLKSDNLSFEDVTYESKPSRADILVSEGDILFAKMINTNKALLVDTELDGIIVSTGFSVHKPLKEKLFGEYFLHFLKHESFQRQKNKLCTGAIQSAISNSGIEKILVPVPDYINQLHIANILSKAENLIAQRKESIRLLDEFLKSTFLEMFGDPLINSKHWKINKLKDCGKIVTGTTPPSSKDGMFGGEIPFITPSDLESDEPNKRFVTNLGAENSRTVRKGATFVCCIGATIGKVQRAKVLSAFNQQLNAIEWNNDFNDLFGEKLMRFMKPRIIAKGGGSTTLPILNKGDFEKIEVIHPPIELQTQFSQIVAKTEALKSQYQQSLQELENLYGSLSQKAFRGELGVKQNNSVTVLKNI
jgi:type I restriction enzyme S subunit